MLTDGACFSATVRTTVSYHVYGNLGSAPDVYVIIHGRGSWGAEFYPVAELLHSEGYAVIVLDLPGHGQSGMPARRDPSLWTRKSLAFVVRDVVIKHLGVQRFRLFGHSLGGVVALEYVGWFPHTVSTLFTMGTHYEIESVPRHLRVADLRSRAWLWNTPLYTLFLRYMWYRSPAVAMMMRGIIRAGGGYDAYRDLMIVEQIDAYDYRESLERFEAAGGTIVLVYAEADALINKHMADSRAFIHQQFDTRFEFVISGGHHAHAADPQPLAAALLSH